MKPSIRWFLVSYFVGDDFCRCTAGGPNDRDAGSQSSHRQTARGDNAGVYLKTPGFYPLTILIAIVAGCYRFITWREAGFLLAAVASSASNFPREMDRRKNAAV